MMCISRKINNKDKIPFIQINKMRKLILSTIIIYIATYWISFAQSNILPDSFRIVVSPSFFWTNQEVDLKITAVKNNREMVSYEWYFEINITDEKWFLLTSKDVRLPDLWRWSISNWEKWSKTYKKWLLLKKGWDLEVCVQELNDSSISWCTKITVYDKNTKKWIIQMLNNYWLTIHKTRDEFKPDKTIRRDEAAKMIRLALPYLNTMNKATPYSNKQCKFNDLDDARSDLQRVVWEACKQWLFKWRNSRFRPAESITNAQLFTVIWRILYWELPENWGFYSETYIKKLENDGYLVDIDVSDKERNQAAKRWTLALLLSKILK